MSEIDVIDQLERYGAWMGTRLGAGLTPGSAGGLGQPVDLDGQVVDIEVVATSRPAAARRPHWRRRTVWIGAAAASIAVLVAIQLLSPDDRASIDLGVGGRVALVDAVSETEPVGGGFVLPSDSAAPIAGAWLDDEAAGPFGAGDSYALVGRRVGAVMTDLISVTITTGAPSGPSDTSMIDTPTGPAAIARFADMVAVSQERGQVTLSLNTRAVRESAAIELLDHIDVNGMDVDVNAPNASILFAGTIGNDEPWGSAGYELTVEQETITVDVTASDGSIVAIAAPISDELEPIEIRGVVGLRLRRSDPEGDWNALLWRETPTRLVALAGHVELGTLEAIADGLRVVDEAEWRDHFVAVDSFPN